MTVTETMTSTMTETMTSTMTMTETSTVTVWGHGAVMCRSEIQQFQ
jgi:hypothetical protein